MFPRTPCAQMPLPCPDKRTRRDSGGKVGFKGGRIVVTCLGARHKGTPEVQDGFNSEESLVETSRLLSELYHQGIWIFGFCIQRTVRNQGCSTSEAIQQTHSRHRKRQGQPYRSSPRPKDGPNFKGRSTHFSRLIHHLLIRECFIDGEPPLLSPRPHKATE